MGLAFLSIGAAWQMIEKLRSMNHSPDLSVLQHVLTLCSKHLQDPDVAAQVGTYKRSWHRMVHKSRCSSDLVNGTGFHLVRWYSLSRSESLSENIDC